MHCPNHMGVVSGCRDLAKRSTKDFARGPEGLWCTPTPHTRGEG